MNFFRKTSVLALSLLSLNAAANNVNQFDYLGISLQSNSYDDLDFSPQIDTSKLSPLIYKSSSSSAGLRGFLGHQLNSYIAIEAGITSFEKADFSVIQESIGLDDKVTTEIINNGQFKTLAGDIRAIGTYPLSGNLFLKAHIGALIWDNEFTFLTGEITKLSTEKVSDTGVSLITGFGIGYGFNQEIAISLDFERTEIAKVSSQSIGASFIVRF
jgi:hypothetical protein